MDREILFRGKRKDNNTDEWVYGYYVPAHSSPCTMAKGTLPVIITKDNCSGMIVWHCVDDTTVGEYIGLKDKNGKRIFEGDIVKGIAYSSERTGVIMWIDSIASFGIRYTTYSGKLRDEPTAWQNSSILKALQRFKYPNEFQAEIIGNIHDNPELIGGDEIDR